MSPRILLSYLFLHVLPRSVRGPGAFGTLAAQDKLFIYLHILRQQAANYVITPVNETKLIHHGEGPNSPPGGTRGNHAGGGKWRLTASLLCPSKHPTPGRLDQAHVGATNPRKRSGGGERDMVNHHRRSPLRLSQPKLCLHRSIGHDVPSSPREPAGERVALPPLTSPHTDSRPAHW